MFNKIIMDKNIIEKAKYWLTDDFDKNTQIQVQKLINENNNELTEAFYKDLEFGTGGLRGIMGVGTNRMNKYTVGMAAQGFCNYIKNTHNNEKDFKVAIAYDSRNNSKFFAQTSADIFSANNFTVYLFEDLRPTPELSFAVRHYNCHGGIVITASHNPKEYNGFKAYWNDGAQLIAPHDKNVINEVKKLTIKDVNFNAKPELIKIIGKDIDKIYLEKIKSLSLSPNEINNQKNIKIVYTPLHGTGITLVPKALKNLGFTNVNIVKEQAISDGNFPTVKSPNPEEKSALEMAIKQAEEINADLVLATDPDADRVGIAIKNNNNKFILLNGNQTAAIIVNYVLSKWKENSKLTGKEYVVKTIVTTELLTKIAKKYNVEIFNVLTGFKYIADIIKQNEGKKTFIVGGEESYGYLAGEFVRDKDAIISCSLIAEAFAYYSDKDISMLDALIDIYKENGFYKETLISIVKKGKSGTEEIQKIMDTLRNNPPKKINNSQIIKIHDYQKSITTNLLDNIQTKINLPKSNVLQFITDDDTKISVRPSGTEPKIKFYISVNTKLSNSKDFDKIENQLNTKIENIKKELNF